MGGRMGALRQRVWLIVGYGLPQHHIQFFVRFQEASQRGCLFLFCRQADGVQDGGLELFKQAALGLCYFFAADRCGRIWASNSLTRSGVVIVLNRSSPLIMRRCFHSGPSIITGFRDGANPAFVSITY